MTGQEGWRGQTFLQALTVYAPCWTFRNGRVSRGCCHARTNGQWGHLSAFLPAWWELTDDQWVLDMIQSGYAPTFEQSHPTLSRNWRPHESASPHSWMALRAEFCSLLSKRAIKQVTEPDSLGFYSHVFLVPKKNRKLQPVINLHPLNARLHCPHFEMETVADILAAIQQGDWATSVDLTDAYFHIPIAPWFCKYLRFMVDGSVFQFRPLPFGLSPAPLVCSRLLAPLAVHLYARGILFHHYLDDLLIRGTVVQSVSAVDEDPFALAVQTGLGGEPSKVGFNPSSGLCIRGGALPNAGRGVPAPAQLLEVSLRSYPSPPSSPGSFGQNMALAPRDTELPQEIGTPGSPPYPRPFTSASAGSLRLGSTVLVARWRWMLQPRQRCDGGCHPSI